MINSEGTNCQCSVKRIAVADIYSGLWIEYQWSLEMVLMVIEKSASGQWK